MVPRSFFGTQHVEEVRILTERQIYSIAKGKLPPFSAMF